MRRLNAFTEAMWAEAADSVGAAVTELTPGLWQFTRDLSFAHIVGQRTPFANPVATELANAKDIAYGVLRAADVPIPEHVVVSNDRSGAFELLEGTGNQCALDLHVSDVIGRRLRPLESAPGRKGSRKRRCPPTGT